MRIGFAGTPDIAADVLQQLLNSNIKIAAIITKPDAPIGRGKNLAPSAVSLLGEQFNILTLKPDDLNSDVFLKQVKELQLDLVIVVAYGKLIPQKVIELPRLGWFNLHYSLLPKYRGATPVQHSLLNGELITGVTFFKIDEGLDTGKILGQAQISIGSDDDAHILFETLNKIGSELIIQCIQDLANSNPVLYSQDESGVSFAPKFTSNYAHIDWMDAGESIVRKIRALVAGPECYSFLDKTRIKILNCKLSELENLEPGEIGRIDQRIYVGTKTADIELLVVQPAGKRKMSAIEWFNGVRMENPIFL